METVTRTSSEAWVRQTLDALFSEGESETRRRLYAEASGLDASLPEISDREFASEFLIAQLNLFVAVGAHIHPRVGSTVPLLKREYLSRLPADAKAKMETAEIPYTVRVREYGAKGIWPYTAIAEVFIERLGGRPIPVLVKRIELALAVQGELWQMDALGYRFD